MSPVAPNAGIIWTKDSDRRWRWDVRTRGTSKNSSRPKGRRQRNGESGCGGWWGGVAVGFGVAQKVSTGSFPCEVRAAAKLYSGAYFIRWWAWSSKPLSGPKAADRFDSDTLPPPTDRSSAVVGLASGTGRKLAQGDLQSKGFTCAPR